MYSSSESSLSLLGLKETLSAYGFMLLQEKVKLMPPYDSNIKNPLFPDFTLDTKGRLNLGKELKNLHLTSRELDILKCLLKGCSAKETGRELGISYRTVESYINSLKLKLGCDKKSHLIGLCIRLGLFKLLETTEIPLVGFKYKNNNKESMLDL